MEYKEIHAASLLNTQGFALNLLIEKTSSKEVTLFVTEQEEIQAIRYYVDQP